MIKKTNVMRILDSKKIEYKTKNYEDTNAIAGKDVAKVLNQDPNQVFKTLVTIDNMKINHVFLVPVEKELDLKKAAKSVNVKSIEMIKQKELLPLTGYIHGGCSPIGMKKFFETVIDKSALNYDSIKFSAGKVGTQVQLTLENLKKVIDFKIEDITK